MVLYFRWRAPSTCTAWNSNTISCRGVGGYQTDGCDAKAEPAVSLACRANNWLYFLDAVCLCSEKAWLSTILMIVTCFCLFPLLFFQGLHFLFASKFLCKVGAMEVVYQVRWRQNCDLHKAGSWRKWGLLMSALGSCWLIRLSEANKTLLGWYKSPVIILAGLTGSVMVVAGNESWSTVYNMVITV